MTPTNDKVDQSGADERVEFIAAIRKLHNLHPSVTDESIPLVLPEMWEIWQARAALQAQPSAPANPNAIPSVPAAFDLAALDIALRFTQNTEPQRRASLKCAIVEALQSLSAPADMPASDPDFLSIDDYALWSKFVGLRELQIEDVPLPDLIPQIRAILAPQQPVAASIPEPMLSEYGSEEDFDEVHDDWETQQQYAVVGSQIYNGNTVSYMYSKAKNYGNALYEACKLLGGEGHVHDRIRKLISERDALLASTNQPVQAKALTDEQIEDIFGELDNRALSQLRTFEQAILAASQQSAQGDDVCAHCNGEGGFQESQCGEGCCTIGVMCEVCEGAGRIASAVPSVSMPDAINEISSDGIAWLKTIAYELRTYNPQADEYYGAHIHKGWAKRIESALASIAPPSNKDKP